LSTTPPERLWTPADVAEYLGVPVATLYQWRSRRCGPRAHRVGRHLRYDPASVRAWLNEQAE
jgi:excisionase family DNA binding protein